MIFSRTKWIRISSGLRIVHAEKEITMVTIQEDKSQNRADIAIFRPQYNRYDVYLSAYKKGDRPLDVSEFGIGVPGYCRDNASLQYIKVEATSGEEAIAKAVALAYEWNEL
jgi:hypothetical protein